MTTPGGDGPNNTPADLAERIGASLAQVPDFPEPGVLFRDFTPLLADPVLRDELIAFLAARHASSADLVAGIESRGFILGAMLADAMHLPFVLIRKAGKLPRTTVSEHYALEYGTATLEVHRDDIPVGARVLVVDDVLATGGTAAAACALVRRCGGLVTAVDVVLEIDALGGRSALPDVQVCSLVHG